ncbi:NagN [Xanthomonas oryzae pv. oryzae KACC 10331]|uniref:NagN n=1 Tax=Xanthomonas oryzae pv. oryzae (strain KACC10331 / KXO85) TaxID=291331 RepID=Q5H6G0_XANOR|nr:NagN [Xanthomonas oryzae pv. oryzae KACC 10331]
MPLSCFKCPMAAFQAAVAASASGRCSSVRRLTVPRWMISTPGLAASTPRKLRSTNHLFRCACCVLAQDPGLLQLLVQRVAVIGGAGEAARADHQALFVRDGHADLHPELVGLARLALADALHFGRVQGIEFVLAIGLLSMDALGALHQRVQILQRRRRGLAGLPDLALHLAQYDAQERALAFEDLAQALELPGMGVAAGFAPQRLGFFGEGLLERDARALGRRHQLVPRVLHQAPIHRMSNGLLLHGGVHDQPFELGGHDGLGGHRGVDGGLEQS